MRRGISLLEVLVVTAMLGMVVAGITRAYISAIDYEASIRNSREINDRTRIFEDRIATLLRQAYVSQDVADTTTFFIAGDPQGEASYGEVNSITFTATGQRLPSSVYRSTLDFETMNSTYGPQGGIVEVSLGMTPYSNPNNEDGLFLREQRPSDGDPSQGGYERLYDSELQSIRFEFFDGLQWTPEWDTRIQAPKRLPAAIQVSYQLTDQPEERQFIVRLPLSDVTPQNPLTIEGGDL